MTIIDGDSTLGQLVRERPGLARTLERLGLDYCCRGGRSLHDACADAGLDVEVVAAQLGTVAETETAAATRATTSDPAALIDELERTHHAYLWRELPRLAALAHKVVAAHSDRHSELHAVRGAFAELRSDLEPHLLKEERVLFPAIRELVASDERPSSHCGSLRDSISVMIVEHDRAGALLQRLRQVTNEYKPPAGACASFQVFYRALAELAADTHLHIHKENNVLFPAVVGLEQGRMT